MDRRSFLRGALVTLAAPAIVRAEMLMPLRGVAMMEVPPYGVSPAIRYIRDLEELYTLSRRLGFYGIRREPDSLNRLIGVGV